MDHFTYQDGHLHAEDVALAQLAQQFGTPCYVYSRATLERHFKAFQQALGTHPHLICYAVKANSNLAVLNVLARLGAGFDIVSRGELERVLAAGGDPARIVFSGVGKQASEMRRALEVGVKCFNVESIPELERLNQVAEHMGLQAPVSLRVNPNVDAKTHPYISTGLKENKFGIPIEEAFAVYQQAARLSHVQIKGIDCHIGSQLTQLSPFLDALEPVLALATRLAQAGIHIEHLDLGGGLGVTYDQETPPAPQEYAQALLARLQKEDLPYTLIFEPGRAIAANAGVLLTQVEYLKMGADKNFAIVDAAMNDLLRPALYQAWQAIIPVKMPAEGTSTQVYDIVGPICETGDFIGKQRALALQEGDLLAVRSAGAYGFAMASNYNTRNRAAEVMVDGHKTYLVRARETYEQQMAGESVLPE
ncbi:diaminopimelate decarboxylase [Allopseudospirillum japonicum]|uniref:Diaminopimelate decarboxylase n=1 Tax=Allopseudospirillum japonicum TaxID=64971 RepID=A0A1H6TGR7_9GAMM|nr:diaminopimelate decarboxylase [Allopseudospirillum japonicum]SEI79273.1 diaminopimelate decarboxylase [Allopseudospirillum japonicum]